MTGTNEPKYKWFHKDRKFFFLKKDGEITHCYQLARSRNCYAEIDTNWWWQVDLVLPKDPTHKDFMIGDVNNTRCLFDDLVPVPRDSEIEYQLTSLEGEHCPIAGFFMKDTAARHPRRHQWGELTVLRHVPECRPRDPMPIPDDRDFVSAPFLAN